MKDNLARGRLSVQSYFDNNINVVVILVLVEIQEGFICNIVVRC